MTDQDARTEKMSREKDKRAVDDAKRLAEDEARKKVRAVKEQKIADDLRARASRDSIKRTAEEPGQEAKEDARRKTYSDHEDKLAAEMKIRETRDSADRQS